LTKSGEHATLSGDGSALLVLRFETRDISFEYVRRPADLVMSSRPIDLADARRSARTLAPRRGGNAKQIRQLRVRRSSIFRSEETMPAPTLVRLIQGSGRSAIPFKLYLLILWMAGAAGGQDSSRTKKARMPDAGRLTGPHTTVLDFDLVAEVLLLDGFAARASNPVRRRIDRALDVLVDELGLIELGSDGTSVRLLAEDGSGGPYTDPYDDDKERREAYAKLPAGFFLCGWFSAMTPPEILALLLHDGDGGRTDGEDRPRGTWFNPDRLSRYAPVSDRTMDRGEKGLVELGLATRTKRHYARASYGSHFEYFIDLKPLETDCPHDNRVSRR
jgi:hypothetical protein